MVWFVGQNTLFNSKCGHLSIPFARSSISVGTEPRRKHEMRFPSSPISPVHPSRKRSRGTKKKSRSCVRPRHSYAMLYDRQSPANTLFLAMAIMIILSLACYSIDPIPRTRYNAGVSGDPLPVVIAEKIPPFCRGPRDRELACLAEKLNEDRRNGRHSSRNTETPEGTPAVAAPPLSGGSEDLVSAMRYASTSSRLSSPRRGSTIS